MSDADTGRPIDLDGLSKPFPKEALRTRKGDAGRMDLTYVQGHSVINRLNAATGNQWSFEIKDIDSVPVGTDKNQNPMLLWKVRGALTIPTCGTRESIGVQIASIKAEDLIKGAVTDCIKKAATLFGVGIELFGPDYEDDGEQIDRRTGEIVSQPRPAAPPQSTPNAPAAPPKRSPRDDAAITLADLAKGLGVSRSMLDNLAVEKVNKTLEKCDLRELVQVMNVLKDEKDIEGLKAFLRDEQPAPGQQAQLMAMAAPTPLRGEPDRYTSN